MVYSFPKDEDGVTRDILAKAPPEIQKAVMRTWFFERYEDPVHSTPYDSEEGGFVYIHGGPYHALEELDAEFCGTVPRNVVQELAAELDDEAWEWSGIPKHDASDDDYFIGAIRANADPQRTAIEGLAKIRSLLAILMTPELELHMYRLLHVSAITCLEVYLCDTFLNRVLSDGEIKRRLVETSHAFKQEKITVATIYSCFEDLDKKLREYLISTLWHNLPQARCFYKDVLQVEFPDVATLEKAIMNRHNIVHRNGKTKDGEEVVLNKKDVEDLIRELEAFIGTIETRLPKPPF
jgi:hypothetical protein